MSRTAAIFYNSDSYTTSGQVIYGRQAAGESFLKGLVQHGTAETLYCYSATHQQFNEFSQKIQPWLTQPRKIQWLPAQNSAMLAEPGALYQPDLQLSTLLWQRRFGDQRAYSICGVTHSLAHHETLREISNLLIAPTQAWDAIICTSAAGKIVIERLLGNWAEYLAQRTGGSPKWEFRLPVIPLGVDTQAFQSATEAPEVRNQLRRELQIAPEDLVVLYVGRLSFRQKAHPVPLYLAIEQAVQAARTATAFDVVAAGKPFPKVHLVQAGWFTNQRTEQAYKNTAAAFCPSVNTLFVDGRLPRVRSQIWCAADIFVSLTDNIQQTFGLTPLEAMAAGLPVIVSDWNGYQETVRHEVDGYRIPTIMPPTEAGLPLASSYLNQEIDYLTYLGNTAITTAVEVDVCAQALTKLMMNPQLRQRLGEQGRQRVRALYDWKVIIAAYEQLWQELAELRAQALLAVPLAPQAPPAPLYDDPFRLFSHYATTTLQSEQTLNLGPMAAKERLDQIHQFLLTNFGGDQRLPVAVLEQIVSAIAQEGPQSVQTILDRFGGTTSLEAATLSRTLVYLIKFNILQLKQ